MPRYRIAFVNPYVTAAEVQAFESLRRAAEAEGVVIEHRKPRDLREDDAYDFLIPVAFGPKTTSHPSLLSCHSPRAVYVDDEEMFANIASHDGYLSISENLKSFFGALCAAWEKPLASVGDYYNCPQRTDLSTDIAGLAGGGELSLCYFGINWDMRAEPLFRGLSQKPWMRIYGPPDSWRTVWPQAYKGQLPFDGASVQREYARFGAGLVCLGYEHLMDDIISNRVFEISSVGAACISPDTPWMRRHFGDSVLYYDPFTSIEAIVEQIDTAFREIRADPRAATERAAQARAIFEERFHAGAMLKGAVDHFERWKAAAKPSSALHDAEIDVVVLGDGAAEDTRASLQRQRAGRVRVIEAGSAGLASVLDELRAPFAAFLRAGDRLLSHHFERLLPPLLAGADVAYSDVLAPGGQAPEDLRIVHHGPAGGALHQIVERLPLGALLVRREALQSLAAWPHLDGADGRLIATRLLACGGAQHRAGATLILGRSEVPLAGDLESRLALALSIAPFEAALRLNAPEVRPSLLSSVETAVTDIGEAKLDAIAAERVFEGGMIGRDVRARNDVVFVEVPFAPVRLAGVAPWTRTGAGALRFHPANPFEFALRVDIADYIIPGCRPSVVFSLKSAEDTLFLGLIDAKGEIVARTITPKSRKPLRVWVNSTAGDLPAEAVIQAWKRAPRAPVVLTALTVAYRIDEVAAAFGRPELTREEAHAMLEARARTETVGEPVESAGAVVPLRHPRSVYRSEKGSAEAEGPEIGAGRIGWDYFAQIFVPAQPDASALRLECGAVEEPCFAFLTDTGFERVLSPVLPLRGGKDAATVWLPLPPEPQDLYLVLQAQETPADGTVALRSLSAV